MNPFKRYSCIPETIRKAKAKEDVRTVRFIIHGQVVAVGNIIGVRVATREAFIKIQQTFQNSR